MTADRSRGKSPSRCNQSRPHTCRRPPLHLLPMPYLTPGSKRKPDGNEPTSYRKRPETGPDIPKLTARFQDGSQHRLLRLEHDFDTLVLFVDENVEAFGRIFKRQTMSDDETRI